MSETSASSQTFVAIDPDRLSRVTLVDYRRNPGSSGSLVYEQRGITVELSVQDEGRTLKVFVTDTSTTDSDSERPSEENS